MPGSSRKAVAVPNRIRWVFYTICAAGLAVYAWAAVIQFEVAVVIGTPSGGLGGECTDGARLGAPDQSSQNSQEPIRGSGSARHSPRPPVATSSEE